MSDDYHYADLVFAKSLYRGVRIIDLPSDVRATACHARIVLWQRAHSSYVDKELCGTCKYRLARNFQLKTEKRRYQDICLGRGYDPLED